MGELMISKNFFFSLLFFSLFAGSVLGMEERIINKPHNQAPNTNEINSSKITTSFVKIKDIKANYAGDKILVIGERSTIAEVWDINTNSLICTLDGHKKAILCATWHPAKDIILTGSEDNTIRIWDASNGKCTNRVLFKRCITKLKCVNNFFIRSIAHTEAYDYPIILAGANNEIAIVRIKDKANENDNRWNIGAFLECNDRGNEAITYVSFNSDGSLAFTSTQSGVLRIYTCPCQWTRYEAKYPLAYEINLGHEIESVTYGFEGYIFIQLKNINRGILFGIINNIITPISNEIADYCANTNCALVIKDQRYIGEYKSTETNKFEGQLIIAEDANIQKAIYNSSGDKIIVIRENNTLNIWTKINDKWLCTSSYKLGNVENPDSLLILNKNKPILASVNSNSISILKAIESNHFIEDDGGVVEPEIIDLTQLGDLEDPQPSKLNRESLKENLRL